MSAGRFTTRWGRRHAAGRSAVEADLVTRLRALPVPTPEPRFKSELRAQLVAITARIVSESASADADPAGSAAVVGSRATGGRAVRALRRPVLALAGASTVLVLLLGMAVWMSNGSLPGQSLYGVKRASENVQLSMAGNDVAKGQAYLELAGNRVREAAKLLSQPSAMVASGGVSADGKRISPRTASLVNDTLASADEDTVHGMQLLGRAAVAQLSKDPLTKMTTWWPGQNTRMTEVRNRLPAGALRTRAQASVLLLQRIAVRTGQLAGAMGCPCLSRALADELGPVPCTGCAAVPRPSPGGGIGTTLPVPVPGVGSTPSGSLPSVSLPTLGGGPSTSGHAAGPPLPRRAVSGLPTPPPLSLPSSVPSGDSSAGGGTPIGPVVLPSPDLPVPLPSQGAGSGLAAVLPSLPAVPTLPGVLGR
ncbi:MAG: hypothetical protein QOE23_2186 [Pseudonocardiales bacterium]|nr:hypothetical protein [Pseudonocardiales bacterium]